MEKIPAGFEGLVYVVDRLLGPGGCPWDQAQTHESLKQHLLEETYETLEAIDSGDSELLKEELGDLILQPIMHAQMCARDGKFSTSDLVEGIKAKLIRRHPHVFGDVVAASAEQVLANWDRIKKSEKGEKESVLGGVPKTLPALQRAHQTSVRAARVGFEWPNRESVREKVDEELAELDEAIESGNKSEITSELGDLLFAVVNLARWSGVEPEDALRQMVDRFGERFSLMEASAKKPLRELNAEEWDQLWNEAKATKR